MDLTTLAVDAAAAKERAIEDATRIRKEQAALTDRALLKDLFKQVLGVECSDGDLIRRGDKHYVIVDGVNLAVFRGTHENPTKLIVGYLDPDNDVHRGLETPLYQNVVHSIEDLARVLNPGRRLKVAFYEPAPGRDTGFHSRVYQPGVGLKPYGEV